MKFLISKAQLKLIAEAEYVYHKGNLGDDLENVRPYGSDSLVRMIGRDTGHFGSGLYFSTYSCEKFQSPSEEKKLTEISKGVYRVDLSIYNNLFRVKSADHGRILFTTLKKINNLLWANIDSYSGKFSLYSDNSKHYLIIKHNLNALELKTPPYKQFIEMMKIIGKEISSGKREQQSFSTRIMEHNNYNGVNVSGIQEFDNTLHGSVIYNIHKFTDNFKPVKDISRYCRFEKGVVRDIFSNQEQRVVEKLLSGEIPFDLELLPIDYQKMAIKRINKFIQPFYMDKLSDEVRNFYYKRLAYNLKNGKIEDIPERDDLKWIVRDLIEKGHANIITDKDSKIGDETFLLIVLDEIGYSLWEEDIEKIEKTINRELSPEEKEFLDNLKD